MKTKINLINCIALFLLLSVTFFGCNDPVKDGSKSAILFCDCNKIKTQNTSTFLKKFNEDFDNIKFKDKNAAKKIMDSFKRQIMTEFNKCDSIAEKRFSEIQEKYVIDKEKNEKFNYSFNGQKGLCKNDKQSEINDLSSQAMNKISNLPEEEITDIDGNVYNTVTIGTQVWMKENLKVTKYRNGDVIATTTGSIPDNSTSKYQWAYNNDNNNIAVYGRLYTWYAVTDSRNVCPAGWHIPTAEEWTTLDNYLGGGGEAGGKLKEAGTTHWNSPNTGADNSSGFTALPGGDRDADGSFNNLGNGGTWWSVAGDGSTNVWDRNLNFDDANVHLIASIKSYGLSVRCLRD